MKKVIMLFAVLMVGLTTFGQKNSVVYKNGWDTKNSPETIGIWEGRSNKSWTGFTPILGINSINEVRVYDTSIGVYFKNKIYKTTAVKRNKKGTKFIIVISDEFGSVAELRMKKEKDNQFYYVEWVDSRESFAFYVKREESKF